MCGCTCMGVCAFLCVFVCMHVWVYVHGWVCMVAVCDFYFFFLGAGV